MRTRTVVLHMLELVVWH